MKKFILAALLFAPMFALAESGGSEGTGGGNTLGGNMIESFIIDPVQLSETRRLVSKLESIRLKTPVVADLISRGLTRPLWYLIPSNLKQLSEKVTGIPFSSHQTAIQVFRTKEVWIDQAGYKNLADSLEREKLIAHEALFAGYSDCKINSRISSLTRYPRLVPGIQRAVRGVIVTPA